MIDVDRRISIHSKILAWLTYSPLYAAMAMPCVFRLQDAITGFVHRSWGLTLGIILQTAGLLLESIADYQKAAFKSMDRKRWCNIGLYKYFLYPNYLGECIFWIGTFIGNMACYHTFFQWGISMVGLTFILSIMMQAMSALGEKQWKKYESDETFRQFRLSHSF
jgi:steroid 5-alpha reductase family enzyme